MGQVPEKTSAAHGMLCGSPFAPQCCVKQRHAIALACCVKQHHAIALQPLPRLYAARFFFTTALTAAHHGITALG
jgi:hypothetical protein